MYMEINVTEFQVHHWNWSFSFRIEGLHSKTIKVASLRVPSQRLVTFYFCSVIKVNNESFSSFTPVLIILKRSMRCDSKLMSFLNWKRLGLTSNIPLQCFSVWVLYKSEGRHRIIHADLMCRTDCLHLEPNTHLTSQVSRAFSPPANHFTPLSLFLLKGKGCLR